MNHFCFGCFFLSTSLRIHFDSVIYLCIFFFFGQHFSFVSLFCAFDEAAAAVARLRRPFPLYLRTFSTFIGITVFNAYYVYLVCCAGVCNIFKFIVSLQAIILRVGDIWPAAARTRPLQLRRCVAHLVRVHFRSHILCAAKRLNFHLRHVVCCLVSRHGQTSHWLFVANSSSHTQCRGCRAHRFVFILYDTSAKWNCLFNPRLYVLYLARAGPHTNTTLP